MTRRVYSRDELTELAEAAIAGKSLGEADTAALAEAYLQADTLVERMRDALRVRRAATLEVRT